MIGSKLVSNALKIVYSGNFRCGSSYLNTQQILFDISPIKQNYTLKRGSELAGENMHSAIWCRAATVRQFACTRVKITMNVQV